MTSHDVGFSARISKMVATVDPPPNSLTFQTSENCQNWSKVVQTKVNKTMIYNVTGSIIKLKIFILTLFRPGFFRPSGTRGGGGGRCNFKTAYAMATKFAQDSVRANSNHCRYCDVAVT